MYLEGQKREVQKLKTQKANTVSDNKFIKSQVKDAMKHNKLLEVAHNKTLKQSEAIRQFLRNNKKFRANELALEGPEDLDDPLNRQNDVFITSGEVANSGISRKPLST